MCQQELHENKGLEGSSAYSVDMGAIKRSLACGSVCLLVSSLAFPFLCQPVLNEIGAI